jgi:hypothetical protein
MFNFLEKVIAQEYGLATWDALLDAANLDGAYTSIGSYPDAQMFELILAASRTLGLSPLEVSLWFGRKAVPFMAVRFPEFFSGHDSARQFLLTVNDRIHPEIAKIYPGAAPPALEFDSSAHDVLLMKYESRRRFCPLVHGLIEGIADFFCETATIKQTRCMLHGAKKCTFKITFAPNSLWLKSGCVVVENGGV